MYSWHLQVGLTCACVLLFCTLCTQLWCVAHCIFSATFSCFLMEDHPSRSTFFVEACVSNFKCFLEGSGGNFRVGKVINVCTTVCKAMNGRKFQSANLQQSNISFLFTELRCFILLPQFQGVFSTHPKIILRSELMHNQSDNILFYLIINL